MPLAELHFCYASRAPAFGYTFAAGSLVLVRSNLLPCTDGKAFVYGTEADFILAVCHLCITTFVICAWYSVYPFLRLYGRIPFVSLFVVVFVI